MRYIVFQFEVIEGDLVRFFRNLFFSGKVCFGTHSSVFGVFVVVVVVVCILERVKMVSGQICMEKCKKFA